jgi:lipoprotein-anchoring transpeptidase ErfK/SrfK
MRTTGLLLLLMGVLGMGHTTPAQLAQSPSAEWDGASVPARSAAESESRSLQRAGPPADATLAHVVGGRAILYNRSDSTAPVGTVPVRTPVQRLDCTDAWCRVRTKSGRTGFLPAATVSNVWVRISKAERRLFLYKGPKLVDTFEIDVGYNTFADKKRKGSLEERDHWRTPEGNFYVVDKRPRSEFYKALVLNYPTIADAERGLRQDLISKSQYQAIVRAQRERRMPPMGTKLGGWIEIHGEGTGGATNWTQGCVAVRNAVMNTLWGDVKVGTPVLIE